MAEPEGQAKPVGEAALRDRGPGEAAREGTASDERVERLESQLRQLSLALATMDARLRELEAQPASMAAVSAARAESALLAALRESAPPSGESTPEEPNADERALGSLAPGPTLGDVLPQIAGIGGRTLLILGGGYLLRDLTERGTLAPATGALSGLVYAAVWLFLAHRQARLAPSISAAFYGVSFSLTAFPLLGEVTVRFGLLTPVTSALAFALAAGAGTFVAWHRRLTLTAWSVLALVLFTVGGTVLETRQPLPFLLFSVALGVAIDWGAASRGWLGLRLAASALADLAMLVFTVAQLTSGPYSFSATLVQLSLFGAYMLFFSMRAQLEKRTLTTFERLQATAVLLVGYLGAVSVVHWASEAPVGLLGLTSLVVGAGAYAIAYFLFVVPGRNAVEAWFNTSYALVGILVGSWLVLAEPGYAWAGIGVLFAVLGVRDRHAALPLHAAVCAFVAALGSGLLSQAWDAFWAGTRTAWTALDGPSLAALGVALVAFIAPVEHTRARASWPATAGKTLALAVAVTGLGGAIMAALADPVGGGMGEGSDIGRLAALRSAVLAAAALGLAALSRLERGRQAALLVYPVLGVGALKLVIQDFPNGRALTLFVALALFGAASIIAPRLRYQALRSPNIT